MPNWEPEYVDCGDVRIACYDTGQGEPLVLLHGNGEDSTYWKAQIPEFSRFYRVLAVDNRGHGKSESGERGLSFALMTEDLRQVLQARGVAHAHLIGFSDGGNLAIQFALTYPEMVDKLILNGANIEMFRGVKPSVQLPIYPLYGILCVLAHVSRRAAHKRDVLGLMVHPYGVKMEDLERITAPTLLLVGEHDVIRPKQTKEMAAHIPHCHVEVFRDGDHFIAARQPARFNRTVIAFLLDQPTGTLLT